MYDVYNLVTEYAFYKYDLTSTRAESIEAGYLRLLTHCGSVTPYAYGVAEFIQHW